MASIRTAIELQDNFSAPMYAIQASMNSTMSVAEDFSAAMGSTIDTSSLEQATEMIDDTTSALNELNAAAQEQVNVDVGITQSGQDVNPVADTSIQEVIYAPVDPIIPSPLVENPEPIIPEIQPNAPPTIPTMEDISVGVNVEEVPVIPQPDAIEVPVNVEDIQPPTIPTMEDISVGVNVEEVPVIPQPDAIEVPVNVEQNSSINAVESQLQGVISAQQDIMNYSKTLDIVPQGTTNEILSINQEIVNLQASMDYLKENPFDLDVETVGLQLNSLDGRLNELIVTQSRLNEELNNMVIPELPAPDPVQVPIEWESANMEIFTNTGVERFEQEVQSANSMLEQLQITQSEISAKAASTGVFSDSAMSDLTNLGTRIDSIQSKIQEIENNPINFGSDVASGELESLRSQLSVILDTQEDLNRAVDNMDVSDANAAYLKLNSNVSATEMYIRDNTTAQDMFNASSTSTMSIFKKLTSLAAAIGIGMAITQASSAIYTAATDLEATEAKFETVFEGYEDVAQGIVDEFQTLTAATESSTRSMVSGIQDLLVPMGYTKDAATEMTGETMTLVGALTNFNSATHSAEDVASAFQSALTGEYESLKALGIQLDVTTVQEQVLAMGLADTTDEITTQMEAQAMLALAYEQSTDALAAYNEESLDTTTRMGILSACFTDTFAEAGQSLLPLINVILIQIQDNFGTIETLIYGFANALSNVIAIASILLGVVMGVTNFMIENWSVISPLIYGVVGVLGVYLGMLALIKAAELIGIGVKMAMCVASLAYSAVTGAQASAIAVTTASQLGLNAAILACPVTWILIAIVAVIAILAMLCNWIANVTNAAESGIGVICGALMVAVAFVGNIFVALINLLIDIFSIWWNYIAAFVNFFATVFNDPVTAIANLFGDLADHVLSILQALASAIDTLFGSNLSSAVSGWRDSLSSWVSDAYGDGVEVMGEVSGDDWHVDAFDYGDAWDAGSSFGDSIASSISDFSLSDLVGATDIASADDYSSSAYDTSDVSDIASSTDDIAGSTSDIADSLEISNEQLEYMRDLAEAEAINRFTTAQVSVDMSGMQNTINSDDDIDGFMTKLTDAVNEAVEVVSGKGD